MQNLIKYPLFKEHCTTLKKASCDNGTSVKKYMTNSLLEVVAFDKIKNDYCKECKLTEIPESNDALFEDGKGNYVFVEFKNGFIDIQTVFKLKKKIYDSVFMFSGITALAIPEIREKLHYILVFNDKANCGNEDIVLQEKHKNTVSSSPSLDRIGKTLAKWATNEEYICFGLSFFKGFCFKEVHTYTQAEFEQYLESIGATT